MANTGILISKGIRPCIVRYQGENPTKALWHMFTGGVMEDSKAVIEFEDGHVCEVLASSIQFLDSKGKFGEYDWRVADGNIHI